MRFLLFTMAALYLPATALCQGKFYESSDKESNRIPIGVRIGLAFVNASLTFKDGAPEQAKTTATRLSAAVFTRLRISKKFHFQPDLAFTSKGFREINTGYDFRWRLGYIDLPLNFLFAPPGRGFYFGGGPALSFNLDGDGFLFADQIRRTDFGLSAIALYETDIGFSVWLSYLHGLSNIIKGQSDQYSSFKNRVATLSVGYLF